MQNLLEQLEALRPNFLEEWELTQELPREAERLIEAFVDDPLAFPPAGPLPGVAVKRAA